MASPYRGRFAPSPTGPLHLGHLRTFLVAWLRARKAGGSILMRMEDLDPPRVVAGAAEAICRDLEWLGLSWDGEAMVQSDRTAAYEEALSRLDSSGHLYPCICSRKDIAAAIAGASSAPHGVEGLGVRYPGTCRDGSGSSNKPPSIRFRMPEPPPAFVDENAGPVDGHDWGGDFVVRRADGLFAYQLAVVVDDIAQGITEVVRGADLLPSTPRQLAIFAALGATPPAFLHVPLLLGTDGRRLSKRFGSVAIGDYREGGAAPQALVGMLAASLGLVAPGTEVMPEELIPPFDAALLPKEPAPLAPSPGGLLPS